MTHIAGKLCAIAMALFAFVVLRVWGVTPFTLLIAVIALSLKKQVVCCARLVGYGRKRLNHPTFMVAFRLEW